MFRKFLILLTIILGLGASVQPASALSGEDLSITLFPAQQTVDLAPGQVKQANVTVANTGLLPFDFQTSVTPYQIKEDGEELYGADFTTVNQYTSIANWITFEQDNYHVEPGETATVNFTITVPEDAVGGGQYAAIMAYTEDGMDPNATFRVASRVVGLIYGRVSGEEMRPAGKLDSTSIPGFIVDGGLKVSATLTNSGNVDFSVYHAMAVTGFFDGKEIITPDTALVSAGEGQEALISHSNNSILPETTRTDTLVWDGAPQLGIFKVKQTIVFLDDSVENERIVIFCPLWLIGAVIGLIILLIIIILLSIRRHKRNLPQVF